RLLGPPRRLDAPLPAGAAPRGGGVPGRVWIYWEQGWDQAPPLVAACRRSWAERNPDAEVVALDARTVLQWVDPESLFPHREMSLTHRSNLIRLNLLARHGGVWVDGTAFCATPLADWLPAVAQTGFFTFSRPGPDRLLSSWFLAAEPGHPLVLGWLARAERYWSLVEKADFYHWLHYLFADMCRDDRELRRHWRAVPRVSADGPHEVQFFALGRGNRDRVMETVRSNRVPVHKLSWRLGFPAPGQGTPLALLVHGAEGGPEREVSAIPVEIALATYNGERYLPALLDSLFAQTHRNFSILASDDGSSDGTVGILEACAARHPGRIRIVRAGQPRLGVAANFSSILPHLTAEHVFLCDQDDVWLPRKIERTLARLIAMEVEAPPGTPLLVHTDLAVVGEALDPIAPSAIAYQEIEPARAAFPHLLVSNVATGCTIAVNRALYTLAAPVPPEAMMHDHWFALVAAGLGRIGYVDEPTILYRQHGGNTIGARPWGARSIADKVRGTLFGPRQKEVLARYTRQAAVFLARYGDALQPRDRDAAAALAGLWETRGVWRGWRLLRHGVVRDGVLRTTALMVTAARGTPAGGAGPLHVPPRP
ncbi:MAG TPA: capsular polysaccharide synthesis protein, partial [Longimicrobium sp.]